MNLLTRRFFYMTLVVLSFWFHVDAYAPLDVSSLATSKGCLFAGTYSGKIYMSHDSGNNWSDVSAGLCGSQSQDYQKAIKCVIVSASDSIHVFTACGEFATAAPDVQWKRLSTDSCMQDYCSSCVPNMEYSARMDRCIIKSSIVGPIKWSRDSGKTWTTAVPGCDVCSMPIVTCLYFDATSALTGFYGHGNQMGFHTNIIISTDSGKSWRATGLAGLPAGVTSITRMGNIVFAGAEKGVYASRDNFVTWWVAGGSSRCTSAAQQTPSGPNTPPFLLKEIRQDGKSYKTFAYNSLGQLLTILAGNSYSNESYAYDFLGRPTKRFYEGFEVTYNYGPSGALSTMTQYYPASGQTWYENYHRGPDGAIINAMSLFNGDTTGYIYYKYDCAGNTIERSEYNLDGTLKTQEKSVYDTFVNPLRYSFPLDITRKGNLVSYYYYSIMMSSPPRPYSSTYEYDASGLPLRETRVQKFPSDTMYFEYIYDKKPAGIHPAPSKLQRASVSFIRGSSLSASAVFLNLKVAASTSIILFDLRGRCVAVPLRSTIISAGSHRIPLFLNERCAPSAPGIYFCIVRVGNVVETSRVSVTR